jgi:hypothetical protein
LTEAITSLKSERELQVVEVCGTVKDFSTANPNTRLGGKKPARNRREEVLILLQFPSSPFLPGGKGRERRDDGCHGVVLVNIKLRQEWHRERCGPYCRCGIYRGIVGRMPFGKRQSRHSGIPESVTCQVFNTRGDTTRTSRRYLYWQIYPSGEPH